MGEVYRATDTTLGRQVAIKVLPDVFAADPERLARFEREAKTLAALNHPHIAQIYGLEKSSGVQALVMELVEGEDLSQRIARGAIPLDEALPIAKQIAEALEAAHEQGIIHRDLKPANIKVTPDGVLKVLDFGLAKLTDRGPAEGGHYGAGGSVRLQADLTVSPTITSPAMMTGIGVLLGTAAYMSPEQAKGRPADKRSDIWAFGCVLYEMLTGKRLFEGETVSDTLAAVLRHQPEWDRVPARARRLLQSCLEKDAKNRLRDMGDAWRLLDEAPVSVAAPRQSIAVMVVAATAVLALAALSSVHFRERPRVEQPLHLSIALPDNTSVRSFALSPDGRSLVMAATIGSQYHLWLRTLGASELRPLAGTDNARVPFWSPDSRFIGFFAEGKLKTIPATGGPAQVLCDAGIGSGGTWNRDGAILFGTTFAGPIYRVAAAGGACAPITKPASGSEHVFPEFLPDGQHFFYVVARGDESARGVYLASLADPAGRRVLADVSSVAYVPPSDGNSLGHVLFLRQNTLMAQPFNLTALQPVGDVFPLAEQASMSNSSPQMAVSSAANGALAYLVNGESGSANLQLSWRDRSGKALTTETVSSSIADVALSPDGKTVAIERDAQSAEPVIWLHEAVRESESRFSEASAAPVWSPDGSHLVFAALRGKAVSDLYVKNPGSTQEELVLQTANGKNPSDWSPDGRYLVYTETDPKTRGDIWLLPDPLKKTAERKPVPFLRTPFDESYGQVSPDGRWTAYTSNESGQNELYVRPFPSGDGRWQVSSKGGVEPHWRRDGQELFYLEGLIPRYRLMAVPVTAGLRPVFGLPKSLFDVHASTRISISNAFIYSPSADGQRFLVGAIPAEVQTTLDILVNWRALVSKPRE
jgi:Tol biopolymer transport system component